MPFDDGSQFRNDPDVLLTYQVIARIVGCPGLRGERITVRVQNRVVILLGVVRSSAVWLEAAERARTTPGVADVCNRLNGPAGTDVFDELVAGLVPGRLPEPEPPWKMIMAVTVPLVTFLLLLAVV